MRSRPAVEAEAVGVDALAPAAAADLWLALTDLERLVSGLRLVVTRKASAASTWRDEGCRSFEEWAAARSGRSRSDAARDAKVADQLDFLPDTEDALRQGQITPRQAEQVTEAAGGDPAAEKDLPGQAKQNQPMKDLRRAADRAKAAASSRQTEQERMRRWRRARDVRFWVGGDGLAHLHAAGPLAELAAVKAAIDDRADRFFAAARELDEPQTPGHHRFDALVELVTEQRAGRGADPSAPHWTVNLYADISAFRNGFAASGECCDIPGIGFVPVAAAEAVLGDAFLNLVITDGADVRTVVSAGRTVPKTLKVALLARDHGCVVCGSSFNLEYDHWRRHYAAGGLTCLANLVVLCRRHHRMRHYDGWVLDGGPGNWPWHRPEEAEPGEAPARQGSATPPASAAGRSGAARAGAADPSAGGGAGTESTSTANSTSAAPPAGAGRRGGDPRRRGRRPRRRDPDHLSGAGQQDLFADRKR